jgi:hypothetical protein
MAPNTVTPAQKDEALAIVERPEKLDALAVSRSPDIVLKEAQRAAKALSKVIEGKPKKLVFNGKTYLQFEDWQTLGRFYGVTAACSTTKYVEYDGESDFKVRGFEARADALLVSSNQVISSAEAMCLNDEFNWSGKPLFQLKSMAQTRACAKALRNVLAWVVVLAGYAPTPAEEMDGEAANGTSSGIAMPQRKSAIADDGRMIAEAANGTSSGIAPLQRKSAIAADGRMISINQEKRLFAIAKEYGWSREEIVTLVGRHGFEHIHEITQKAYGPICGELATRR